jgi:transcriptional regulator of arginine metabolism
MDAKGARHQRIAGLLQERPITSQEQLQKLLAVDGLRATQATLSRDLRELGVVKGPGGYALAGVNGVHGAQRRNGKELAQTLRSFITSVDRGGNLLVLRTGPGRAQPVALELDNAKLSGVLGTVAGDDTIFVAAKSNEEAGHLVRLFKDLAGVG